MPWFYVKYIKEMCLSNVYQALVPVLLTPILLVEKQFLPHFTGFFDVLL